MGTSVTSEFKRSPGASYLNVAIDIALSIIQTLAPGDYVDVISFNSTGAYSLSSPVNVGNYTQSNGVVLHPELDSLQNSVKKLTKSADPPRSNLTAAIIKAVSTFQNTALNYLKVIRSTSATLSSLCSFQPSNLWNSYIDRANIK